VMAVVSGRARRARRRPAPGSRYPRWAGEWARRWPNDRDVLGEPVCLLGMVAQDVMVLAQVDPEQAFRAGTSLDAAG
jgi:hypothetical protein